jgi:3-deoxy-7-phosphoheptulonate synthase
VNLRTDTSNLHVAGFQPLIAPNELLDELPLGDTQAATVRRSRDAVRAILAGEDDRLLAVVGPCSVHDADAAVDYAVRLAKTAAELDDELCVVMRVYFEKPRTTVGWKGLINDSRPSFTSRRSCLARTATGAAANATRWSWLGRRPSWSRRG